jgi:hypothetical protein
MGVRENGIYQVDVESGGGGGGSNVSIIDGTDATKKATVFDFPDSNPLAVVLVDTNGDPYVASGGGGGGAVTIADGADVTEGAIADAKVTGDVAGTVSAKLRGINTSLASIDTKLTNPLPVSGTVTATPTGTQDVNLLQVGSAGVSLGAKISALSIPVVLATDEAALPVTGPLTDAQLRASALAEKWDTIAASGVTTWTSATPLNSTVTVPCISYSLVSFRFVHSGPNLGIITFEASIDGGVTYDLVTAQFDSIVASGFPGTRIVTLILAGVVSTTPYNVFIKTEAFTHVRVRLSTALTAGETLTVQSIGTAAPSLKGTPSNSVLYGNPPAYSSNAGLRPVAVTGANLNNGLFVNLADATAGTASTVKAASTLPASTDTAIVVTLRDAISLTPLATAASPSYVEGAASPLSLDLTGDLRTSDIAVLTQLQSRIQDTLDMILRELCVHSALLQAGLNVLDEPDRIRSEADLAISSSIN